MGTPDFAVASLQALVEEKYNVVAVITAPDRPAGRGRQLQQSAVKQYALSVSLPVLQPEKLKDESFIRELKTYEADLQVVVAFRMLPEVVWAMPKLGTFNLHGSLLPQYRGAAPLNWAIINGEKETGVTTFLLSHEIDTGAILFHEKITIDNDDNVGFVHDRLMHIGSRLVLKTVDALAEDSYSLVEQDDIDAGQLKPAPKIFKEDCQINWNLTSEQIKNLIRGLSPYPAAFTTIVDAKDKELGMKIYDVAIGDSTSQSAGFIDTDSKTYFKVASADRWIFIKDVHLAGKKRMKIEDFLRGMQQVAGMKIKM